MVICTKMASTTNSNLQKIGNRSLEGSVLFPTIMSRYVQVSSPWTPGPASVGKRSLEGSVLFPTIMSRSPGLIAPNPRPVSVGKRSLDANCVCSRDLLAPKTRPPPQPQPWFQEIWGTQFVHQGSLDFKCFQATSFDFTRDQEISGTQIVHQRSLDPSWNPLRSLDFNCFQEISGTQIVHQRSLDPSWNPER